MKFASFGAIACLFISTASARSLYSEGTANLVARNEGPGNGWNGGEAFKSAAKRNNIEEKRDEFDNEYGGRRSHYVEDEGGVGTACFSKIKIITNGINGDMSAEFASKVNDIRFLGVDMIKYPGSNGRFCGPTEGSSSGGSAGGSSGSGGERDGFTGGIAGSGGLGGGVLDGLNGGLGGPGGLDGELDDSSGGGLGGLNGGPGGLDSGLGGSSGGDSGLNTAKAPPKMIKP